MRSILIAPSILAADFSRLADEVRRVEEAGADWIHCDIMDGHFVDNISFGSGIVTTVRKLTTLPLDIHLMIQHPDHYLPRFLEAASVPVDLRTTHVRDRQPLIVGPRLQLRQHLIEQGGQLSPMPAAVAQFYDDKPPPKLILLSHEIEEAELLADALDRIDARLGAYSCDHTIEIGLEFSVMQLIPG